MRQLRLLAEWLRGWSVLQLGVVAALLLLSGFALWSGRRSSLEDLDQRIDFHIEGLTLQLTSTSRQPSEAYMRSLLERGLDTISQSQSPEARQSRIELASNVIVDLQEERVAADRLYKAALALCAVILFTVVWIWGGRTTSGKADHP